MRMSKSGLWMTLLAAVGVTAVLARWFKGQSAVQPAPLPKVRSAGPEAMQSPRAPGTSMTKRCYESFSGGDDPPGLRRGAARPGSHG